MLRKVLTITENLFTELGVPVNRPVRKVAVVAVVANPWAGKGYVEDLQVSARPLAVLVANTIGDALLAEFGTPSRIEAFGKGVIVGEDGELEHGSALIHTPFFADVLRACVEGTAVMPSAEHRGPAGSRLVVPMGHKGAFATRSHYTGSEISVADAPRPDEIVVVGAAASGPRPNARVGDRTTDPPVDVATLRSARRTA
ncbi:MAG TPA: amino acid synthesis family protein [Acidimicrobiales bacterium]|nr:amino acid synthesis family protein [Acidimicrobiales bacterium]